MAHAHLRPLFSVIIPCYNSEATIASAIQSVLSQDDGDFELIVVDDGSRDRSVLAAVTAIGGDARGRVMLCHNAGPAAARNHGASLARGRLLAFLDSDDRWASGLLSAHREKFSLSGDIAISFGRTVFFDSKMETQGRCSAHHASLEIVDMLAENPLCTSSNIVVRRDVFEMVGGFDDAMRYAEDQEFVVRVLATTSSRVVGIDAPLVHYRTSAGGLSADLSRMERGWDALMTRARQYCSPDVFAAAEAPAKALHARYLARRALRTGQPGIRALRYLWTALRADTRALLGRETRRTLMTAAGVAASLLLPHRLIAPLIAA